MYRRPSAERFDLIKPFRFGSGTRPRCLAENKLILSLFPRVTARVRRRIAAHPFGEITDVLDGVGTQRAGPGYKLFDLAIADIIVNISIRLAFDDGDRHPGRFELADVNVDFSSAPGRELRRMQTFSYVLPTS